ncbi:DUF169 domain-containing protein [Desulfotalea psychrophila]|uniref:Uncharacterized protein n=1 Tax=Desulfotalea psychrophila (strain LSv54 / DSM 12343) TaxID=177439 RepID=Q6AP05_DESPS|nr:DUF169 domain-containing protein [Desulfotalea psychrophila]CAG35919.1 hypothetical protein DP1190 [Desulfotalea psychrophila LSv54]
MDFKKIEDELTCLLGLSRRPVAVSLTQDQNQFDAWPQMKVTTPLSFCAMVRLATTGRSRKTDKEGVKCFGAADVFGFRSSVSATDASQALVSMGLYSNIDIAQKAQASMSKFPTPCLGLSTSPLSETTFNPSILLLIVDAYQAMRIVQGWAYFFGGAHQFLLTGNRGICSECVAKPWLTDSLHLSPLCANTRYACKWDDHELGIGVPFAKVEKLLEGIAKTVGSVEPELRKNMIEERFQKQGLDYEKPQDTTYFLRK